MLHFSIIFNLFSLELYERANIEWPSWVFWNIEFSNNTNSRTPTFKHSHSTIKLEARTWSSTFITVFFHIPTPIIFDSISIVLLQEILRILAFRFNTKKLGFEVFWIGEEPDPLLLEEILVILECRLQIL